MYTFLPVYSHVVLTSLIQTNTFGKDTRLAIYSHVVMTSLIQTNTFGKDTRLAIFYDAANFYKQIIVFVNLSNLSKF